MSTDQPTPDAAPPDDLPPVQPPSAGFLVQLFLVPGIIVAVLVVGWIVLQSLVDTGSDPQKYIEGLRRDTPDSWQKAENLAEMLQNDRSNELKGNPRLAATLADILNERIDAAQQDEKSVTLRVYLCRALGRFNTPEVLPVLIKAATTNRDPKELVVRCAALDAIATFTWNANEAKLHGAAAGIEPSPELLKTVLDAAHDPEGVIRLRAAFVLGIVGGEQATARLRIMLDDPERDVSFNAATALARHGDSHAIGTLLTMLDPAQLKTAEAPAPDPSKPAVKDDPDRHTDPRVIIVNGLRGVAQLADADPSVDLSRLEPAVDRLREADLPHEIRDVALAVHDKLDKRHPAAAH